jgi:hypothetical protein
MGGRREDDDVCEQGVATRAPKPRIRELGELERRERRYCDNDPRDSQLAPPTGPTRCSFLIHTGTPGHVSVTCFKRCFILRCHHSTRSWFSGTSVDKCEMRS